MQILQINKYSYPKGGADKYFLQLSSELEKAGHQVRLFSMTEPRKLRRHVFWSWSADRVLTQIIKEFQPTVAHLHNIYHDLTPSILYILKRHHIPTVLTLHDYKIICPNYRLYTQGQVCSRCRGHKFYNCFLHRCLKNSYLLSGVGSAEAYLHQSLLDSYQKKIDLFISPSQFLIKQFKDWGFQKKITYLPNFVSVQKPAVKKENYLLYLGRLEPEKGLGTLLEAMKLLPQEKLLVAGTGSYSVKETANVKPLGWQKDINALVARAKLLIVPSQWSENNPLNVLEAQELGTAVLASRIGGLPELTDNLFNPGDPRDLAEKIKNFQDRGIKIKNDPAGHVRQLINLYGQIL